MCGVSFLLKPEDKQLFFYAELMTPSIWRPP